MIVIPELYFLQGMILYLQVDAPLSPEVAVFSHWTVSRFQQFDRQTSADRVAPLSFSVRAPSCV